MIAVEGNRKSTSKSGSTGDAKGERRPLNPAPTSSWDTDAFAKRLSNADEAWKESESKSSPSRLQDISVGLGSNHEKKPSRKDDTWPYESSPCRMFGGKNTKKGGEAINKELFDPDFVDHQDDSVDFSDADSFCGDDDEEEDDSAKLSQTDPDPSRRSQIASQSNNDLRRGSASGPSHTQMLAWNKKQDSDNSLHDDADDEEKSSSEAKASKKKPVERGLSRTSSQRGLPERGLSRTSSQRGLTRSSSHRELGLTRSSSQRALDSSKSGGQRGSGLVKSGSQRALSAGKPRRPSSSTNEEGELKKSSSSERKSSSKTDELSVSSMHSSGRRKSKRSSSNDLSAATVHGTADGPTAYSRGPGRRSSRTSSRSHSGDTMEVRGSSRSSKNDELGAATLHGKASISRIRKERRGSLDSKSSSASRRAGGAGKPDRRGMLKRAMSTTNVKRPEEYHGGRAAVGSLEKGGAQLPDEDAAPRRGKRPQKPVEPRRDIIDLLREQKAVTEKDLSDKDNLKVLNYLMMEHKMSISLKELARTVKRETKDGVVPAAPKLPLYVDA